MSRVTPFPRPLLTALLAFLLPLASTVVGAAQEHLPPPPNLVVVLADDLGIGDLGCYNDESKIPTPNLDALAADGMRFSDMHSPSAVCTPTRYGLLTGRYCWRSRLRSGVLNGYDPLLIEPGRPTIASILRAQGYRTGCVGKWHLGLGESAKTDYEKPLRPGPVTVGFDSFFGIPASLDMPPYVWVRDDAPVEAPNGKIAASLPRRQGGGGFWRAGAIAGGFRHQDVLEVTAAQAISFLERAAPKDQGDGADRPFFLYVALPAPHTPWLPAEEFRGRSGAGYYGDFVAQVDDVVGRIVEALDRLGHRDDTLLIVTSDNGSHWPAADIEEFDHRANLHFRGQKADIHEGGHRVPFLARWPGRIAPGATSEQTACLTDLLATAAAVAACDVPDGAGEDSFDLSAVLLGRPSENPVREAVVHHSMSGMFAIRSGRWKLILGRGSGGFTAPRTIAERDLEPGEPRGQLYDLVEDPGETRNVFATHPAIVERLTGLLDDCRRRGRSAPARR